jgi:hypothetical protein
MVRESFRKLKYPDLKIEDYILVPDHDGGRPIKVNACILITHMVYL